MALCDHGYLFGMNMRASRGGTITALRAQQRRPDRVNVYLDGEFAFGLALVEAAHLKVGQSLTAEEVAVLGDLDAAEKAHDRALRFLTHRQRSVREVRDNLARARTPPEVVDRIIQRLEQAGLLGDQEFARFWVQGREQFRPRSRLALRSELRQKGVEDATIARALEGIDDEAGALQAARAQVRKLGLEDYSALRERVVPFLMRRGFSYAVAAAALKQAAAEWATRGHSDNESEEA